METCTVMENALHEKKTYLYNILLWESKKNQFGIEHEIYLTKLFKMIHSELVTESRNIDTYHIRW